MANASKLIENYYAIFNSGDREAFLALLSEDVVHDINQGGRETGKAAFRGFMDRMDRCYHEQISDIVVMTSETGEHAAAAFTVHGVYIDTDEGLPPARGQKYSLPAAAVFKLSGGKVAQIANYYNLPAWLEAVSSDLEP